MKEIIELFFITYQNSINAQIDAMNNSDEGEDEDQDEFNLEWSTAKIDKKKKEGLFKMILKYSNILESPQIVPNFHFIELDHHSQKYFPFALTYEEFFICTDVDFGTIVLVDNDFEKKNQIAKDEISFLQILIVIVEFELQFILDKEPSKQEIIACRNKCIELAGGANYNKFYNFIIANTDENPEQPF